MITEGNVKSLKCPDIECEVQATPDQVKKTNRKFQLNNYLIFPFLNIFSIFMFVSDTISISH